MRLQLFLSRAGVDSRRRSAEIIRDGRVTVNGRTVKDPAFPIDLEQDHVKLEGRPVRLRQNHRTVLLHKPPGVMVTHSDPQGRPTVFEQLRDRLPQPLYAAGRLDYQSEGALILSTDGDLIHRLSHPRHKVPRVYQVKVRGKVDQEALEKLRNGVELEDGPTAPAKVFRQRSPGRASTWLKIVLQEGRNRQLRRMGEAVGHPVQRLKRTAVGPIRLGGLAPGRFRDLTTEEREALEELLKESP